MLESHEPLRSPRAAGLCPACAHVRRVVSSKGSLFLRCGLSAARTGFPKYPPQPVRACPAFEPRLEARET